jgi:hypothetical protein
VKRKRSVCRSRRTGRFSVRRLCGAFRRSLVKLPTMFK